jgi:uncharacterized protein YjaG (DUF416 family)
MKMRDAKLSTFAQIRELPSPNDIVFACALMQRMLPNYQLFSQANGFGDGVAAQATLNLIWEWCMSPKNKFNAAVQLEKLEEIIPDVENFDNFGVYPALDYCMALSSMLLSFSNEHDKVAVTIAKLSQGSVEAFILATAENELDNQQIKQDPLMEYEIETQLSLLEYCRSNKITKDFVKELRADIVAQAISNLGLSADDISAKKV